MNQKSKKSPSEYPMFGVRLTLQQKAKLNRMVEDTRSSLNQVLSTNEKLWMKNDVIYEALLLGIPLLEKKQNKETEL
ncbi:MAG: hypothetical protein AB7T49_00265 [Oligoflexales bacterium]